MIISFCSFVGLPLFSKISYNDGPLLCLNVKIVPLDCRAIYSFKASSNLSVLFLIILLLLIKLIDSGAKLDRLELFEFYI